MKRWAFHFIFYLALSIFLYDTVLAEPSETVSSYVLSDLQYEVYPEFSRIIFSSNDKIDFTSYELQAPYRIVIDLLGVSFCELQERIECDEGLVESIEIVKTPYAQKPQGLDEYFYAVDYIIITPRSDFPYTVSSAENGRIIALDIGTETPPGIRVSKVSLAEEDSFDIPEKQQLEAEKSLSAEDRYLPKDDQLREDRSKIIDEHISLIDYIDIESTDDYMLVIISTNNEVLYSANRSYYPVFNIVIKPKTAIFTDLQEYIEFDTGYIKSLRIVRDKKVSTPKTFDSDYYPVEFIVIEPAVDLPFDLYSNDDGTISILEIYYPGTKDDIKLAIKDEKEVMARAYEKEEEEQRRQARKELLTILKKEIKKEGLLKEEKVEELKKDELERIRREASRKVESIGLEVLKDLLVRGKGMLSLSESQSIALENNPQAKTAKQEVKLAMLKKRDAFRALFPNAKLKVSHTVGDVFEDISFTEELYGIEGEHPLYQGGRIMNAYKQSKVNVELAEARYNKIEHELDYKVAEAYHNIITAIMNIRLQNQLLKEAEPILKLAEKRHAAGLSTKLEILNVQSRYNQIQFQIATAERDLALGRFKLQQAMGLDISNDDVDVSEVDTEMSFKIIDVNLYECLEAAANNQPDIIVNKLLVESNEYGEKIAKGKQSLRIDLTGFYGKGDSYYDTEPKNLETNWNVGVKVSKPFWFATPSYSFTKDKTSLQVGQNDRTGSTVNAGELALYDKDALAMASEIEESKVNKQKAENDLIDTRRQTALSVKEAYYNYQEAVIQVKNSLEKVSFYEETVKVAKVQSELNEALQSQLLESLIQLVDEKSVYIKALSDYNLAIIKLNNAVGIRDYFKVD